jgi:hypothetical protein
VLALVLSLGLHWALLQTIAWTGMIVSYARDGSLVEAVNKTFDGEHPCCMCKTIKKARSEQDQKEQKHQLKPGTKLDQGLVWKGLTCCFGCDREPTPAFLGQGSLLSYAPPKPRPRAA